MKKPDRTRRLLLYAIPLIAIMIIGVAVFANYDSGRVAMQAEFDLVIEKRVIDSATTQVIPTSIKPAAHIGEAGGFMYTQKYLGDGVGGNYPIHTVDRSGFVYIDSKVVRDYTLGDFFAVWGEPLGVNNTLGFKANYTTRAPSVWSMCIRAPDGRDVPPQVMWGDYVLKNKDIIDLVYSQLTCG